MSIKVGLLSAALTFNCVSTRMVHLQTENEQVSGVEICYDEKKELFLSKKCVDTKCYESVAAKMKGRKFKIQEFSSPSFSVCMDVQGSPELTSVAIEGKEYDLDVCYVDKYGAFLSSGILFDTLSKVNQ